MPKNTKIKFVVRFCPSCKDIKIVPVGEGTEVFVCNKCKFVRKKSRK